MSRQRLQHHRSVATALDRTDVEAELLVKSIALAPFRVEVLFVICTLLSSKRKVDFQDALAEMGLVDILNQMFLRLKWNEPPPTPPSPADSIYRFWLASCVESFLRRSSPAEQLFVARTPLLAALLKEILSCGFRPSGSLQSAFDLLGEMTKNNPTTLVLFSDSMDDVQFASFMQVVVSNLVDSNVFVRSMLLSVETHPRTSAMFPSLARLFEFLQLNSVRLLRHLMTIVTLDDINHENICCLNTAVVMLVFEHRQRRLPRMLELQTEVDDGNTDLCVNFRSLLWFWVQYYVPRGRDRLSLEHSSDMKFNEWYSVVALLCADDGSPAALLPAPTLLPASPYVVHHMSSGPRASSAHHPYAYPSRRM
ncbi:hypothetical protein DYB28_007799 [Aphanomyces astaci]|uniref:Uncharacterized protein n=1 Tax=Aphanomyces astaci TaxID=112090 RepID=A0A9X8DTZ5_APHAT|nr:hypothetical protein DYB28_007799 [Aphanomyces astaci]